MTGAVAILLSCCLSCCATHAGPCPPPKQQHTRPCAPQTGHHRAVPAAGGAAQGGAVVGGARPARRQPLPAAGGAAAGSPAARAAALGVPAAQPRQVTLAPGSPSGGPAGAWDRAWAGGRGAEQQRPGRLAARPAAAAAAAGAGQQRRSSQCGNRDRAIEVAPAAVSESASGAGRCALRLLGGPRLPLPGDWLLCCLRHACSTPVSCL